MSTVDVEFYLVIGQRVGKGGYADGRPSVSAVKNKPAVAGHEVAIAVTMRLPLALFKKPQLSAHIEVPAGQAPAVITPEIQQNIADHFREQHGIVLRIEAPQEPTP